MASLDDVIVWLPCPRRYERLETAPEGLRYIDQGNAAFVPPPLRVETPIAQGATSVVLISAPAAVGKSTFARELAHRTGALLWDLSGFQVGHGTFDGTLATTFGYGALGDIVTGLQNGTHLILVDALDEAQLRAGTHNFEAFIQELCDRYVDPRPNPTLVLLARAETADEIQYLWFEGKSVPYARWCIDFFDEELAREFIDRQLDVRSATPHRQYRGPFIEAVGELFGFVYRALGVGPADAWDNENVRSFLGYAPVLQGISEYLDTGNYQNLIAEIRETKIGPAQTTESAPWHFLTKIVSSLLRREQDKVINAVRPQLQPKADALGWDSWDDLFGPEEQCRRVLIKSYSLPAPDRLPRDLPSGVRDAYEESLSTAMVQHPFRGERRGFANVVFEEYVYAWHLSSSNDDLRKQVLQNIARVDYLPTPLLARFLLSLSASEDGAEVAADVIGPLYESLLSQASKEGEVAVRLVTQPDGAIYGAVSRADEAGELRFTARPSQAGIHFWRRLSHAVVDVRCDVAFGIRDETFTVGPDVDLECTTVRWLVPTVKVVTKPGCDVMIIAKRSDERIGASTELRLHGGGSLRVHWEGMTYPWVNYRLDLPGERYAESDVLEIYTHLSRILRWFQGTTADPRLSAPKRLVDNIVVGSTAKANRLRDHLIGCGLIVEEGRAYRLDGEVMAEQGLNWPDLRCCNLTPQIRSFLSDCLAAIEG